MLKNHHKINSRNKFLSKDTRKFQITINQSKLFKYNYNKSKLITSYFAYFNSESEDQVSVVVIYYLRQSKFALSSFTIE